MRQGNLEGAEATLRFDETTDFVVAPEPQVVTCRMYRGASLANTRHLLLDQVLPRVLADSGHLAIHASAVAHRSGAVLFLGTSGSGKSTLTAHLAKRGFTFLGDDCFVLAVDDEVVYAHATYPSLRLLPQSIREIYADADTLLQTAPIAPNNPKLRMLDRLPAKPDEPRPVRALVVLKPASPDRPGLRRLSDRDAVVTLLENSFRLDVTGADSLARTLDQTSECVANVEVFELEFAHDFTKLAQVEEAIQGLLTS